MTGGEVAEVVDSGMESNNLGDCGRKAADVDDAGMESNDLGDCGRGNCA